MYKERITDIGYTLHRAFTNCKGDPKRIQVVVVRAPSSTNDDTNGNTSGNDNGLLREQLQQHFNNSNININRSGNIIQI